MRAKGGTFFTCSAEKKFQDWAFFGVFDIFWLPVRFLMDKRPKGPKMGLLAILAKMA